MDYPQRRAPVRADRKPGNRILLPLVLLFTSFTSLVYEIIWSRKLGLVFGANTLAVTTVLSVYMAGLALGTLLGGKLIEKAKKPYRFLSLIELSIGLSCLATLFTSCRVLFEFIFTANIHTSTNISIRRTKLYV